MRASRRESFETLLKGRAFKLERIVSQGHATPKGKWYDQPRCEWVLLMSGAARLLFENGEVLELKPGDFVDIPAHRRHRVEWTHPRRKTVWLALHYAGSR